MTTSITTSTWRQIILPFEAACDYPNPFLDVTIKAEFTLNQAGHGDFPISASHYREYRCVHPDKPFIEGESMYEFCSTLEENGSRLCTADMVRRAAYTAMQSGACGYTYGAQGIWDSVWERPETPDPFNTFNRFGIPWYESIDGIGAVQMGYMRQLYEEERFDMLHPISAAAISPLRHAHRNRYVQPSGNCGC